MKKEICWPVLLYIGGYHLFLLIALPIYFCFTVPSLALVMSTLGLVFASGIAITAGYHRLYSHSTYKAHRSIEPILLFFGSLATQGSVLRWANDHRLHHAFVDKEQDPYTVKDGFWHAHILWLFRRTKPIDPKVISDLSRNPLLQFQHNHYLACMLFANISVSLLLGWILGDYIGAFLFGWFVRMFLLHHTTWCINSLAHYWGTQSYSQEHSAVDNYLISLLTYGEGYHNYHHTFSHDYRNGIHWYHFDPAKWLIWTLNKLGLAYDLKRVNNFRITKELLLQHKNDLLQRASRSLQAQVVDTYERLTVKLSELQTLVDKAKELPKKEWTTQIRKIKLELKEAWKDWRGVLKQAR